MAKVVKITAKQLQTLINEEASKYKKVLELKNKKEEILSQLNEMYEAEELDELFGYKNAAQKEAELQAKNQLFDGAAQAYLATLAKSPQFQAIATQQIAKSKPVAVQNAIKRDGEMGAQAGTGKFVFVTNTRVNPPQVVIQYALSNAIPSTGKSGSFI